MSKKFEIEQFEKEASLWHKLNPIKIGRPSEDKGEPFKPTFKNWNYKPIRKRTTGRW
jgi:hypothetical protein